MAFEGSAPLPSRFGRYTLLERLAVGGMAEVFRAKIVLSHGFEKLLVIKRILPRLAEDKTFVSMFIDEAKLTAQLTHPKIVQILDFGDVSGQYFITLELVDGFDALVLLRTCAQRKLRLPTPLAVFVIMDVLEALDYAHNARDMEERPMHIVHRDISPSNIFISKRGDVKLGDFGIAHTRMQGAETQAGTLKGKYGYMSPEQVNAATLDGRSDLYSVGIVLAEMLMGRRLFIAPTDLDTMSMVRDGRLDRLDKYGGDLPATLDAIVRRALAADPALRYPTASAFRGALADYLLESGRRVSSSDLRAFAVELFEAGADVAAQPQHEHRSPGSTTGGVAQRAPSRSTPSDAMARVLPAAPPPEPPPARAPATDGLQMAREPERSPARGSGPSGPSGPSLAAQGVACNGPHAVGARASSSRPRSAGARTGAARSAPSEPYRPPDSAGDIGAISPMRVFSELAVKKETGLLRFELPGDTREIYFLAGAPESVVSSSQSEERFGEYLVAKGALRTRDLERARSMLPCYAGRLSGALVGLGLMKPLDVFRLLSQQVQDRVVDVFTWSGGAYSFFRGVTNEQGASPLGLDALEILGLGALNLSQTQLERSFSDLLDLCPGASGRTHIAPAGFRLGSTPGELLRLLDGQRDLRSWMRHFTVPTELLTFLRSLYLLVETDLARFD